MELPKSQGVTISVSPRSPYYKERRRERWKKEETTRGGDTQMLQVLLHVARMVARCEPRAQGPCLVKTFRLSTRSKF